MDFLFVGIGGAAGSMLRYAISLIPYHETFPLLTLITNLCGAFLIGCITGIAARRNIPANMLLLLKTGLCGGFTTFSTFSLEAYTLMQNGHYGYMFLYILMSLFGCIVGIWCGMTVAGLLS